MSKRVEQLTLWQMPEPGSELIGRRVRYWKQNATITGICRQTAWGTLYTLRVDGYVYRDMQDSHIAYKNEFEVIR